MTASPAIFCATAHSAVVRAFRPSRTRAKSAMLLAITSSLLARRAPSKGTAHPSISAASARCPATASRTARASRHRQSYPMPMSAASATCPVTASKTAPTNRRNPRRLQITYAKFAIYRAIGFATARNLQLLAPNTSARRAIYRVTSSLPALCALNPRLGKLLPAASCPRAAAAAVWAALCQPVTRVAFAKRVGTG